MDNQIITRKMQAEDYPNAYALWQQVPGMNLREFDDSFEEISRLLRFNPNFCFVAETKTDKQIIGSILGATDGRRGTIYHLAVAPGYQNQGLGTQLVNKVIEQLQAVGIHKIFVKVMKDNLAGQSFWQHLKFVKRSDVIRFNKII
ncbi:GNAT family N-acetyltransferase [Lentilactobacillus buchneri]|nr:GNAT family N-acetyltransferase [Lentilactobacillus sp. Egmn17]